MGEQPRTVMASEGAFTVWLFIGIMKVSSHAMCANPDVWLTPAIIILTAILYKIE